MIKWIGIFIYDHIEFLGVAVFIGVSYAVMYGVCWLLFYGLQGGAIMSSFIVGEIGIITSASKFGPDRQGKFQYVGCQEGFRVRHYIFQNIPGDYIITYTNRDFITGDVSFTKEGERIKSSKRLRGIPKTKVSSMPPFLKVRVLPI